MRKLLKLTLILSIIVSLTNCAALGTKTVYKSETNNFIKPKILGYSQLQNETLIDKIVTETSEMYSKTMQNELKQRDVESRSIEYPYFEKWTDLDKQKIADICISNNLDGIIFTKLIFIQIKYTMMFIPISQSLDTEVEMQYFDANGNLILHTKHNTANGNAYPDPPIAEKTIPDGVKGALKRIFKEIDKK